MNKKIVKTTLFGPVCIIWSAVARTPKIVRVLLSIPGTSAGDRALELYPEACAMSCAQVDVAAAGIKNLLEGEAVGFSLDLVDLGLCGEFQRQVLCAGHRIPRGTVSTYGLIAAYLGRPNGARAVGNALANNPFPLIVPCHRMIRSDRHPGGYQGGLEMKHALLEVEGMVFDEAGRVKCPREGGKCDPTYRATADSVDIGMVE